jgi:hypothetical protein
MKTLFAFLVCAILGLAVGCKDQPPPAPAAPIVKTGGRELTGGGVKFMVPAEDQSGHSDAPHGLTYESSTLKVTYAQGLLYVNATNYGAIKPGDVVNLLNPGRVYINDKEVKQQPVTGMFRE